MALHEIKAGYYEHPTGVYLGPWTSTPLNNRSLTHGATAEDLKSKFLLITKIPNSDRYRLLELDEDQQSRAFDLEDAATDTDHEIRAWDAVDELKALGQEEAAPGRIESVRPSPEMCLGDFADRIGLGEQVKEDLLDEFKKMRAKGLEKSPIPVPDDWDGGNDPSPELYL